MSSSREQQSNNPNNNNAMHPNQFSDYEIEGSINPQQFVQQPPYAMNNTLGNNMGQPVFQQMYPFEDVAEEDLPNEIVAELDARERMRPRHNDVDESVFSDAVQDAFKKYQNETWGKDLSDNESFDDDEQEELYSQMEECWNFMKQENDLVGMPEDLVQQSQQSHLNPDATEFKPSWLKPSSASTGINGDPHVTVTSSSSEGHQQNL